MAGWNRKKKKNANSRVQKERGTEKGAWFSVKKKNKKRVGGRMGEGRRKKEKNQR